MGRERSDGVKMMNGHKERTDGRTDVNSLEDACDGVPRRRPRML